MELDNYFPIVFAAGHGSRMPNLTEHVSKALLPVANLPLYWFPLNLLRRNGFKKCLLVVPESEYGAIESDLCGDSLPGLQDLNVEIVCISENEIQKDVDEFGTADVCRHFLNRFDKENILIVSGDLVSDLSLDKMLKFHEEKNSMFTSFLTDSSLGGPTPGSKEYSKKYKDLIMWASETNQLLYMLDEDDYCQEEGIPLSLFQCSTKIMASAKYKDVHLYAIKRDAISALSKQKSYSSLKADLIPHLLHGQFSESKRRTMMLDQPYKCYAYFSSKNDCSFIAQCNHTGAYFEANKAIQRILPKIQSGLEKRIFQKTSGVNCTESLVSQNVKMKGKCQIKRSIIADWCEIGDGVKIDNSVIMPRAIIHNRVTLKNSIVFSCAEIGESSNLTMCIIAPKQKVKPGEKSTFDVIDEKKEMIFDE